MVYILDLTEVSHLRLNCASFQKCELLEGLEREKTLESGNQKELLAVHPSYCAFGRRGHFISAYICLKHFTPLWLEFY